MKNLEDFKIKNLLIKQLQTSKFKKDNLIVVIGGDGFMLQTLKKNRKSNKYAVFLQKKHFTVTLFFTKVLHILFGGGLIYHSSE